LFDSLVAGSAFDILGKKRVEKESPPVMFLETDRHFRIPQGGSFREVFINNGGKFYPEPKNCLNELERLLQIYYRERLVWVLTLRSRYILSNGL
jgi:hypothetical protein